MKGFARMAQDYDDFRRRTQEARASALLADDGESVEVAGHLALAYAALARRRKAAEQAQSSDTVDPVVASIADDMPLMLRD